MLLNYKLRKINQTGGKLYGAYKQLHDELTMTDDKSETVRLLMYHGTIEDTNTNVFFCQEAACDIKDDPFIKHAPEEAGGENNPSIDPPNDQWVIALKLRLPIHTQLQEITETFRSYFWDSDGVKTGIERMGVRMNNENTLKDLNNYIIEFIKHGHDSNLRETDASWPSKLSQLLHLQKKCYILKDSLERLEIQIDDFENLSFDFRNENTIFNSVFENSGGEDNHRLSKHVEVPVTVPLSYLKNDLKNRIDRSKPTRYMRDAEGDIITTKNRSLDLQSMKFLYNYKPEDLIGQQNINGMKYNIYKATINCEDPLLKDLFGTSIGTHT